MQVTIDIPEELARRVGAQRADWVSLIEQGIRERAIENSALAREVVSFLSKGPSAAEILAFRPSDQSVRNAAELLDKNRAGALSRAEAADLDDMAVVNRLFTLIKAQAREHLRKAA